MNENILVLNSFVLLNSEKTEKGKKKRGWCVSEEPKPVVPFSFAYWINNTGQEDVRPTVIVTTHNIPSDSLGIEARQRFDSWSPSEPNPHLPLLVWFHLIQSHRLPFLLFHPFISPPRGSPSAFVFVSHVSFDTFPSSFSSVSLDIGFKFATNSLQNWSFLRIMEEGWFSCCKSSIKLSTDTKFIVNHDWSLRVVLHQFKKWSFIDLGHWNFRCVKIFVCIDLQFEAWIGTGSLEKG